MKTWGIYPYMLPYASLLSQVNLNALSKVHVQVVSQAPVSYTHLDVYKRQGFIGSVLSHTSYNGSDKYSIRIIQFYMKTFAIC